MNITIKDNFLDFSFLNYIEDYFLYKTPHYWGHTSTIDSNNPIYISKLSQDNIIVDYIYQKINQEIINLETEILSVNTNIQFNHMQGELHSDNCDVTALLMITNKSSIGGGEFEYVVKNNKTERIEYKPNRLIVFNSKIGHRGLPYHDNNPRITLAYKLKIIK